MVKPTAGSLFTGIGGFDLGFKQASIETVWQVEIDAKCNDVLIHHWPDIRRYGDVRTVGRHNLEPVDIITGGFPCQDVSVAGKRKGLAGERSGLWFEFHRVLEELKPRWVVVENVPGLLSSNGGRDFAVILRGLAELGYGVCWRVLDAQYFGVAQRRRRVFIVGSLGNGRSAEVLLESESGAWDPPPSREEGKGIAAPIKASSPSRRNAGSAPIAGELVFNWQSGGDVRLNVAEGYSPPLQANQVLAVAHTVTSREGQRREPTIETLLPIPFSEKAACLYSAYGTTWNGNRAAESGELFVWQATTPDSVRVQEDSGKVCALTQWMGTGGHNVPFVGVRRLTPTECERLQGFPDGWTAVNGQKDSARYRQLGNAVCVPVAEWLGRRIREAHTANVPT